MSRMMEIPICLAKSWSHDNPPMSWTKALEHYQNNSEKLKKMFNKVMLSLFVMH